MKIGSLTLDHPVALAPMAGMTDTAFRRLVKGMGGCGLVVTEMVSSEGLVRGIDRTLEYAEYTEAERPVSIQIFGGDPKVMADAAQIVEGMGADIVDINMGCPVPKIAKHNAGCSLMREPAHAAEVVRAMASAVRIPVTVKMRAGWNEQAINAPDLARMVEDAGAAAVAVHGRTAAQSYTGESDWKLIGRVAETVRIPVFGSGDCVEPGQIVSRLRESGASGVLVGRGALRNPWIFSQAAETLAGRTPADVSAARARPVPARLHGPASPRASRRGGRLPAHGARSAARRRGADGPGTRALGDQQAARPGILVHKGTRRRVAATGRDQLGSVDSGAAVAHRALFSSPRCVLRS